MHGMISCHGPPPAAVGELVCFHDFAHRLPGVNMHSLISRVRVGHFPPPVTWRGRNGQAQWRAHEVEQALGARTVEVFDGEEAGPLGDP